MPLQPDYLVDIRHEIAIPTYWRWSGCEDEGKTGNSTPYETSYVSNRAYVGLHSPAIWEADGIAHHSSRMFRSISVRHRVSCHSSCHSRFWLGTPRCDWTSIVLVDCLAFSGYRYTNGKEIFITTRKPGGYILNFQCFQIGPVQGAYNRLAFSIQRTQKVKWKSGSRQLQFPKVNAEISQIDGQAINPRRDDI